MFKLKLVRGLSYSGYGVKATNQRPIITVDKKEAADALIASGHFSLIAESGADNTFVEVKSIEKKTEKELDAYARENGIDLSGVSGKAKKLAKIQEVLAGNEDDGSDLFNDEN